MAETVNAIVKASLRLLNVKESGENLNKDESADGLIALNDLIEEWNLQNLMQPAKVQITQAITSNDGTYTFGTGGDNSVRPIEIFTAWVRDSTNSIDYPLRVLMNEEYSRISYKSVTSTYPDRLFFRNAYPLSTVILYPIPSISNLTLHMECRAELSKYTDVGDSVDLPPGYLKALKYNLALQISPEYKEPSAFVVREADKSISWIKRSNAKDKPVMLNTARVSINRYVDAGSLFGVE